MYHRVETLVADPWQLAVTPDRFARQIALLRRRKRVVPLSWLATELKAGRLPARAAALTFDDGYGDVFRNALPILEAEGCSATVFVTTGAIGCRKGFWWDQLSRIVCETPSLPDALALPLGRTVHAFRIAEDGRTPDRAAIHCQLHALLKAAPAEARQEALDRLAEWAGAERDGRESDLAMSADELRKLASAELIEIGAHTVSHPSLPLLSAEDLEREVVTNRRDCEAMTGRAVTGFAYPFGDHDVATIAAVRAAGFSHACITVRRAIRSGDDPLAMPRLPAANWDEAKFEREVLTYA
jgi:peptidoglycan/xylan/chitin deacetylase (PgdA/CDA1 family)